MSAYFERSFGFNRNDHNRYSDPQCYLCRISVSRHRLYPCHSSRGLLFRNKFKTSPPLKIFPSNRGRTERTQSQLRKTITPHDNNDNNTSNNSNNTQVGRGGCSAFSRSAILKLLSVRKQCIRYLRNRTRNRPMSIDGNLMKIFIALGPLSLYKLYGLYQYRTIIINDSAMLCFLCNSDDFCGVY